MIHRYQRIRERLDSKTGRILPPDPTRKKTYFAGSEKRTSIVNGAAEALLAREPYAVIQIGSFDPIGYESPYDHVRSDIESAVHSLHAGVFHVESAYLTGAESHEYYAIFQLLTICPLDLLSPGEYAVQASLLRARDNGIVLELPASIFVFPNQPCMMTWVFQEMVRGIQCWLTADEKDRLVVLPMDSLSNTLQPIQEYPQRYLVRLAPRKVHTD